MKYLIGLSAIFLCACQPQSDPPDEEGRTVITIDVSSSSLMASWRLPEPALNFTFEPEAMPAEQRLTDWELAEPGWEFDGQTLSRTDQTAFRDFTFHLNPAKRFYDRKYVPVEKIGEDGWLILAAALSPNESEFAIKFRKNDKAATLYANGRAFDVNTELEGSDSGMIYFGPRDYVRTGSAIMIAGNEVPGWISNRVIQVMEPAAELFASRLNAQPPSPPFVTISYVSDWQGRSYKGSVIGDVISLHLRGADYEEPDDVFTSFLENLVVHESFHIWNGTMFESSENAEQPWLHEGSAEYIANRLTMDKDQFDDAATRAFNMCRLSLGATGLLTAENAKRGRSPYNCGHVIHLIVEAAANQKQGTDILDVWAWILDGAKENGNAYDSDHFLEAAAAFGGDEAITPIRRILLGLKNEDVPTFQNELNTIGIDLAPLSETASEDDWRELSGIVLRRLLQGSCSAGYGYWSNADHYKLNTGEHCGEELAGNPEVIALNGHSLIDDPLSVYHAAQQTCKDDIAIVFTNRAGEKLDAVYCNEPLNELPDLYSVKLHRELRQLRARGE